MTLVKPTCVLTIWRGFLQYSSNSTKLSLSLVSLALFLLENENDMKEPAPLAAPASEPAEVARTLGFSSLCTGSQEPIQWTKHSKQYTTANQ